MKPTIGEILASTARKLPDKTVIICDDRQITYQELNARVNQLAHGLLQNGINKGSKVATLMYNSIELVEIYFALATAGIVGIPLNFRLTAPELYYIIENSDATALIIGEEFESTIEREMKENIYITDFILDD